MAEIFKTILGMSLTAIYCIAAVFVLRSLLRKQAKLFSYLLWSVVLFRLLCPVSLTSSYSLLRMDPNVVTGKVFSSGQQAVWQGKGYLTDDNGEADNESGAAEEEASLRMVKMQETDLVQRVLAVCARVWLIGVAVLLGYSVWSAFRLRHFLSKAYLVEGWLDGSAEEKVCEMDGIATPFVFGMIRPRIYLPAHLQPEERRYVLAHERVHIARMDHLVKLLFWGAVCLHWFNPLVWLSFRLMESDMEMSCDETVLRRLGEGVKQEYSRALLSLSCEKAGFHMGPVAFGEGGLKGRIRNILSYKRGRIATAAVLAMLLCVLAAGLMLNPSGGTQTEETGEKLGFLNRFANAYCDRDGKTLVEMYVDEETAGQSLPYLDKIGEVYTFGFSSPWPNEFRCVLTEELGEGRNGENRAEIWYYAWTSDPHVTVWKEELRFVWTETGGEENYRVTDSEIRYMNSISSKEEFDEAYLIADEYQFTDYVERGFLESIQFQTESDRESGGEDRNAVYRSPDTAAEWIFNLTGGSAKTVSTDADGKATVRYTFADGSNVLLPMVNAAYRNTTETTDHAEGGSGTADDVWLPDLKSWKAYE
ncbi:MAG: hypothetical protein OSJ72_14325 [Lachnospiraceae bacterium]|nr:hypothetical protein [Lachnospiraceae bacterium]